MSANGSSSKGARKRWLGTTWKMSPARMYAFAASTISR